MPINIETPIQPVPVKSTDGKWYLVYHLFLTNWSFSDLTLKSAEVSDGERNKILARYEDKELSDFYRFRSLIPTPPRSEMPNRTYPRQIASGRTGVLFFWLTVGAPNAIPSALNHRFTFQANPLIKQYCQQNTEPRETRGLTLNAGQVHPPDTYFLRSWFWIQRARRHAWEKLSHPQREGGAARRATKVDPMIALRCD